MDALLYMSDILSDTGKLFGFRESNLEGLLEFIKGALSRNLAVDKVAVDKQQALIMIVRETAPKVGKLIGEFVGHASRKQCSNSEFHDLVKEYRERIKDLIGHMVDEARYLSDDPSINLLDLEDREGNLKLIGDWLKEVDTIIQNNKVKNIENMLLDEADISNGITLNEQESEALFCKRAFPDLFNMQNDHERRMFYHKLYQELGDLLSTIPKACEKTPLALFLIGGLLSLKPMANYIWNRVKDELHKIKGPDNNVMTYHMGQIVTYCYNDLPYFLQRCFLYFACYPIGFEIPATSLTQKWIAEGFIEEEDKQMSQETTANKYLDELVQRSLVFVSKRSFLGTIKSCRLPHSIHEFVIQQSYMEHFSVANPVQGEIETRLRVAIYQDNKKQCTEVKNDHIRSFLAFNFDRNILESAILLKVLALWNSAFPVTALPNMIYLRYLGLRGSNRSELPENIGDMKNLQTLDARDTWIETLPKSLWNIKTLRHVYVEPSPQIIGPPSEAHIDNLHTLKTVAAHGSWVENIPRCLIHVRKLAFSNWNNLDVKSISNLFIHMDKLISVAIMGKIISSKFIDLRVFPNLETVKSINLQGEWISRKLFIDNVKFPPNLTKLTLTTSGLMKDPMPTLERLHALKFLSLKDGAYTGKQMVCSANGFPQLQFLELEKLENLENWEVKPTSMPQLTKLRVVQCQKLISNHPDLGNHPNLNHVTDKVID